MIIQFENLFIILTDINQFIYKFKYKMSFNNIIVVIIYFIIFI